MLASTQREHLRDMLHRMSADQLSEFLGLLEVDSDQKTDWAHRDPKLSR